MLTEDVFGNQLGFNRCRNEGEKRREGRKAQPLRQRSSTMLEADLASNLVSGGDAWLHGVQPGLRHEGLDRPMAAQAGITEGGQRTSASR